TAAIPEYRRPGQHTMVLDVGQSAWTGSEKVLRSWDGGSGCGATPGAFPGPVRGLVGWGQTELPDGTECGAYVLQLAVLFDSSLLDQIEGRTIDQAVLTYDEAPGILCPLLTTQVTPCWSAGDGAPEAKPDGCVVARIPSVDWPHVSLEGLIPYLPD